MVTMQVLKDRQEWLNARVGIGGSDASSIVGMNPYRDNVELWRIKTGLVIPEDIGDKPYVKYGTEAEPLLRELFALDHPELKVEYVENNMWKNERYPFAHASLDGWITDQNGRKGILEIKTTEILQSMQKEKWNKRIPDNYYLQVLHYLMVTEFDFVILVAQLKTNFNGEIYKQTKEYRIERSDVQEDIEYLKKAEMDFWQHVRNKKTPGLILPSI